MKTRMLLRSMTYGIAAAGVALSLEARADAPATQLATGQFVTPTAPRGALQRFLNPGLPAYPNFVAGEAVRSQLSPDGTTLAILCAGHNSLDKPDGTTDTANSTQFIFLYDVSGAHKEAPALLQVIPQVNAHVGLIFSPDGSTLYATGGRDDAVYVYKKMGGVWLTAGKIALNHGATALASVCSRTPAASESPPTAPRWWSPTTTTTQSA